MRKTTRIIALAAALGLVAPACGILKDPREAWQKDISYEEVGGRVVAVPSVIEVDGPFGLIIVTNNTDKLRGFAIDALNLAFFEDVRPDASRQITIEELRDNRTYHFYDHKQRDRSLQGLIVVRYVAEEER